MKPGPGLFFRFIALAGLAAAAGWATPPAMAQRPLGVDVSHYQGAINWTLVQGSGVSFGWAKATEYASTTDGQFASNISGAKAAGVMIGAYHFAHPELDTPLAEADFFWSVAGGSITNDGLTLQPCLDFETFSGVTGAASYADWANQWCNAIVSKAAAVGITVKPVIYTSTCGGGYLDTSVAQWNSWIANPSGNPAQTSSPWVSTSCNSSSDEVWGPGVWTAWQYSWTATVPGIAGGCDADVFNGTPAQLVATLVVGTNAPAPAPPAVSLSPQLSRVMDAGGSVSITGVVSGALPLTYQWLFNNTPIPGATNKIYQFTGVQTTNAGNYALVVTNSVGSTTSSVVSLTVYPVQAPVFTDAFDTNSAANWIVNKSSGDNSAVFNFDYSALGILSAPHSTGGSTFGVQLKANLTLGVVAALSISPANQSFGGDYRLHFDAWINVNGPFPGGGLGSTEFLTAGLGTAGNRTEWTGSGSTADGFYFSADGDGGVSAASTTSGDYAGYAGTAWKNAATGIYAAGSLDNANIYYTSAFPGGHPAPALQSTNYPQQSGTLNPGTFGLAWHDVIVSRRGSTVDWAIDGIRIATITNASFTASNVCVGFWDPFASLSSNSVINFGLVDNLRVEVPAIAPVITTNPLPQTVTLGANAIFLAAASGLPAPNYQWQFNGTNIAGATNTSLALGFVSPTNTGYYSLTATNLAGTATSSGALLALLPPAAARFQAISVQGGVVQIGFTGDAVWNYTIESSADLINWSAVTNLTSTNGVFNFSIPMDPNNSQEFYRARVGP